MNALRNTLYTNFVLSRLQDNGTITLGLMIGMQDAEITKYLNSIRKRGGCYVKGQFCLDNGMLLSDSCNSNYTMPMHNGGIGGK